MPSVRCGFDSSCLPCGGRALAAPICSAVLTAWSLFSAYRLYTVVPRLVKFVDVLTNWYVRMNRRRLKVSAQRLLLGAAGLWEGDC